jgi:hypothetical protein
MLCGETLENDMRKGPLVQAAAFCETVIEGKDGTITLVRLIDRMTVSAAGPEAPKEMPAVSRTVTGVIALKAGSATGRMDIRIVMEKPSTESNEIWSNSMLAEAPDRGQNFMVRLNLNFDQEGLYWFHVFADEDQLTSIPLRLVYARQSAARQTGRP